MTIIDEIKNLMKSGDAAGAEALCRKALETAPDDARLSLYLATCRQLQGDEAEFRRIMLDLAPKMEALLREDPDCEAARLWRKSGAVLMEYVVLGVLVVAAIVTIGVVFGPQIRDAFNVQIPAKLYGPARELTLTLYEGPRMDAELIVKPAGTNIVESATTNNVAPSSETPGQPSQTENEKP